MNFSIDKIFMPITANSFGDNIYLEAKPSDSLKPYIRCFWYFNLINKSPASVDNVNMPQYHLVIPDICTDIIISRNEKGFKSHFCGISDKSFKSENKNSFLFGIRFYAWRVNLFTDESLNKSLNVSCNTEIYFNDFRKYFSEELFYSNDFSKMISVSEKYLLKKINTKKENFDILNSIYYAVKNNADLSVRETAEYCNVSKRKLERVFLDNIGASPKKIIDLIRYQMLWQECIKRSFNSIDCAYKFGYYDQSHMINDFKKYHGMNISQARENYFSLSPFYNTV